MYSSLECWIISRWSIEICNDRNTFNSVSVISLFTRLNPSQCFQLIANNPSWTTCIHIPNVYKQYWRSIVTLDQQQAGTITAHSCRQTTPPCKSTEPYFATSIESPSGYMEHFIHLINHRKQALLPTGITCLVVVSSSGTSIHSRSVNFNWSNEAALPG